MSVFINQLDILSTLNPTQHWLIIDTPGETMRANMATLQAFLQNVRTVNTLAPDGDGNVNLTPDNISDVVSSKKFISAELLALVAILVNNGDGTLFLANDGTYKAPPSGGGGGTGTVNSVNTQTPDGSGNVTLTTENISDATSDKKFIDSATLALVSIIMDSGSGSLFLADDGTYKEVPGGSGITTASEIFEFDSDLFTEQAILFVSPISDLAVYKTDAINSISYEVGLDANPISWTACANLTDLQTWITANASSGIYWIKVNAVYKSGRTERSQVVLTFQV